MSNSRRFIALVIALFSLWASTGESAYARAKTPPRAIKQVAEASPSPSASNSPVPASFAIHGSGFGHGIGLSQYGAQGMATDGSSSDEIIEHYFPGASVSPTPMPSNLIVGLLQDRVADNRRFIAVRSEGVGGAGKGLTIMLGATKISAPTKTAITFGVINNQVVAYGPSGIYQDAKHQNIAAATATITWGKQTSGTKKSTVANIASANTSATAKNNLGSYCAFNNCSHRYKYGYLTIAPYVGGTLNVTNTVRLDDEYLYGLGEMPSSWKPAALESQAIAGRSYAFMKYKAKPTSPYRAQCACQIYATTVDQNFVGFAKEYATSGTSWVAAVDATAGKVAMYNGRVIETFFSSSTGGYTQPLVEAWGTSGYPWLTKVDDHWSTASPNPNAKWTQTISQSALVGKLRAAGVNVKDIATFSVTHRYASGAVSEISVVDSVGRVTVISVIPTMLRPSSPNISPSGLRSIFGLKSTYIRFISPSARKIDGSTGNVPDVLQILNVQKWPISTGLPGASFSLSGSVTPTQMGVSVVLADFHDDKWTQIASIKTDIAGRWTLAFPNVTFGSHKLRILARNSVSTIRAYSMPINLASNISLISRAHYKKVKSSARLSGVLAPATKDVTVYLYRKVKKYGWQLTAKTFTNELGKFSFLTPMGPKKGPALFKVKVNNSTIGSATSSTVTITIR